jgi:pyruvate-ferredoxin/flavodoxin oxidoreductase
MKEFTPNMVKAIYDDLDAEKPKKKYIIGIEDDVNHSSMSYGNDLFTAPKGNKACVFWGLGSDGTIGASKTII